MPGGKASRFHLYLSFGEVENIDNVFGRGTALID